MEVDMPNPFWRAIILIASITSTPILEEPVAATDRPGVPYGLQDILALAAERNPAIAGAEGAVAQNRGQRVAAAAYPNPSITASGGRGAIRDPSTGVSITERSVTVQQPVEWPSLRQARQRAAEAGLAGSYAALEDARLIVTADVKVAFYQLLLAQRDAELADQNVSTVHAVADVVQVRVASGEGAQFEAIKANVEVQKARKEVARTQNALRVARGQLNMLTGKALGLDYRIQGDFDSSRPRQGLETLIASAFERNPSLRRQRSAIEQADHTVIQERASRLPSVTVQGTYHREAGDEAITAGISIPVPLWYRRQGEIETALGTKRRAEAESLRASNELEQAITQYYQEAETAQEQITVMEQGMLKQAKEALEIAQFSFQQGAASLLEVLDAQRVYRQTLFEYAQARADRSMALARLARWTGDL
jgi:cobalt-zinc-cadmium efflux system outer membrane protein